MDTRSKGVESEKLAREFLESFGYRFLAANFHRRVGELDLVMLAPKTPRTLVFVEVRYRKTPGFGGAVGSVDWKKQRRIVRTAKAWLQSNAASTDCARIDVIAISPADQTQNSGGYRWKEHCLIWISNAVECST